jgi:hypothetical protein
VTPGAKGRDTSALAALAAAGALGAGDCTAFAGADFFADFFFGALFRAFFFAFFFAPRFGADFFALFFFLPAAFLRADFLRGPAFFRADFPRFAGFRAARLRLLFLRAAMCFLRRDAIGRLAARILRSPLACLPCKSR